ncbi:MAG: Cof-type HAD-IIB family hydrolase [Spirochaetota bacterium]
MAFSKRMYIQRPVLPVAASRKTNLPPDNSQEAIAFFESFETYFGRSQLRDRFKRMYKLLATDIDDTLLAPDGSLPEQNREVLRRLHKRGVTIVFCSGRADVSIQRIASAILEPVDNEYLISFNGARVVTARSRTIVSRDYVEPGAIARVVNYAQRHDLYLQGYQGDRFFAERETDDTRAYARATQMEYEIVSDLVAALPEGSPKLLLIDDHDVLLEHTNPLYALSQANVANDSFEAMFSKSRYLEVVRPGVNKGTALAALARRLRIDIGEVVAVGDSANDVDMIKAAGVGVAVASGREEAKRASDLVLERRASEAALVELEERLFSK